MTIPAVVLANSDILAVWSSTYPASLSDDNAGCQLCHGSSLSTLNEYGLAISSDPTQAGFEAVNGTNSDGDPGGFSDLAEINANSQPGWRVGPNNTLYSRSTGAVVSTGNSPPASITGLIDPPTAAPNIVVGPATLAFGTVTVGASPSLNVTVQNTGTATLTVSGITVTGTSEFTFVKTTPFDVAAGGSTTIPVTYTPAAAGADSATLAVASNDPDTASAPVTLTGTGQVVLAGATYVSLAPARILDTRIGTGLSGTFASAVARTFQVTGTRRRARGRGRGHRQPDRDPADQPGLRGPHPGPDQQPHHLHPQLPAGRQPGQRGDRGPVRHRQPVGHLHGRGRHRDDRTLIFDVTGYFVPDTTGRHLRHASTPARLLDTRIGHRPLGHLQPRRWPGRSR